ncbi:apidaecins type 73-like [Manis pentadactyla]|uniref:apidaecins type 73-like n=1 Tax=Manis pentadactyla TaxID=143292 RepID=UPI00255C64F1|nr:apidaecins type 73-like [Manis pentadactyla]
MGSQPFSGDGARLAAKDIQRCRRRAPPSKLKLKGNLKRLGRTAGAEEQRHPQEKARRASAAHTPPVARPRSHPLLPLLKREASLDREPRRPRRTGACAPRPEPPDRLGRPDPHSTSPLRLPKPTKYSPATPQPRNPRFRRPTRGRPQAAKPAAQTRPPLPRA